MRKSLFLTLLGCCLLSISSWLQAEPLRLYVPWPDGWELRQPVLQNKALTQEARKVIDVKPGLHLQITAIAPPKDKPVPSHEELKTPMSEK